jgi:hypothetical protein
LYNDCFLGINDNSITGREAAHYLAVADRLKAGKYGKFSYIFCTMRALAEALEVKADLGARTRELYRQKDKGGLFKLAADYKEASRRIARFHRLFEKQWYLENKPFGFELQDTRLGGLLQRLKSCRRRLLEYCAGKIDGIAELDENILPQETEK